MNSRKYIISGIFSLIVPGLGQVYNGQWKKGWAVFITIIIPYYLFLRRHKIDVRIK